MMESADRVDSGRMNRSWTTSRRSFRKSKRRSTCCGGLFDVPGKQQKIAELEQKMAAPDFWDHPDRAQGTVSTLKGLNATVKPFEQMDRRVGDIEAMMELASEEGGESMLADVAREIDSAAAELDKLEFKTRMSDPRMSATLSSRSRRARVVRSLAIGRRCSTECTPAGRRIMTTI